MTTAYTAKANPNPRATMCMSPIGSTHQPPPVSLFSVHTESVHKHAETVFLCSTQYEITKLVLTLYSLCNHSVCQTALSGFTIQTCTVWLLYTLGHITPLSFHLGCSYACKNKEVDLSLSSKFQLPYQGVTA